MSELAKKKCIPCEGGSKPLVASRVADLRRELHARWQVVEDGKALRATYDFKNYYRTTAFVNAVAWIAHTEDHHPDISFGYKSATVRYSTHSIGGLSENDFICAAKVDALVAE